MENFNWIYPKDIKGWLTEKESKLLALLATGKDVLEVGTYEGLSACSMIQTAKSITCVDPHIYGSFDRANMNIGKYAGKKHYELVNCRIQDFKSNTKYNFLFLDATHIYEETIQEYKSASKYLTSSAIIAFHDYQELKEYPEGWFYFPGIKRFAIEEFGREPDIIVDTLGVYIV